MTFIMLPNSFHITQNKFLQKSQEEKSTAGYILNNHKSEHSEHNVLQSMIDLNQGRTL
jgi:hypothetical protein